MGGNAQEACKLCPDYGKVWSCPPGTPSAEEYLEYVPEGFLVGVKVNYSPELRKKALEENATAQIRMETYEVVKKKLHITLLALEKCFPMGLAMGAGRCRICHKCAREDGKPCRNPDKSRYSMTAFGFNFKKMVEEQLGIQLLWSAQGLPEYDVAVAGIFHAKED